MKVAQSSPTLWDAMDSTGHGILQARTLEGAVVPFSRASSQPRSPTLQVGSLLAEPLGKPFPHIKYRLWPQTTQGTGGSDLRLQRGERQLT